MTARRERSKEPMLTLVSSAEEEASFLAEGAST